eukprot:10593529-Lingulodinium_polyedra.AAC.1
MACAPATADGERGPGLAFRVSCVWPARRWLCADVVIATLAIVRAWARVHPCLPGAGGADRPAAPQLY